MHTIIILILYLHHEGVNLGQSTGLLLILLAQCLQACGRCSTKTEGKDGAYCGWNGGSYIKQGHSKLYQGAVAKVYSGCLGGDNWWKLYPHRDGMKQSQPTAIRLPLGRRSMCLCYLYLSCLGAKDTTQSLWEMVCLLKKCCCHKKHCGHVGCAAV